MSADNNHNPGCRQRIAEGLVITIVGTVAASILFLYIQGYLPFGPDQANTPSPVSASTAVSGPSTTGTVETVGQSPTATPRVTDRPTNTPPPSDSPTPSVTPTPTNPPPPTHTPAPTFTPTPIPTVSTEGLVARYGLDGNAVDLTGNGHDGIAINVTPAPGREGNPNGALSFNGIDSVVVIPDSIELKGGRGPVSVTVWFNTKRLSGRNPIVTKFKSNSAKDWGLVIRNGSLHFMSEPGRGSFSDYSCEGDPTTVEVDEWTFAAFVASEPNITLYLNGQPVEVCTNFLNQWTDTDAPVKLGEVVYTDTNLHFLGEIDDLFIFNRALTQAEVMLLYNEGLN